jgi:hypothetical protein
MPDTPPVVTISLCSNEMPFDVVVVVIVPFVVGWLPLMWVLLCWPFVEGRASEAEVWSAWDMGKEKEFGATKALAWAAVVGRLKDSIVSKGTDSTRIQSG